MESPAAVADGRGRSRTSLVGWASGLGFACVVAGITFATRAHELPLTPFVASATKIASGQVWVLLRPAEFEPGSFEQPPQLHQPQRMPV